MSDPIASDIQLNEQIGHLQQLLQRTRRALEILYKLGLAFRGAESYEAIFEFTYNELCSIFKLDSCYVALCDPERPDYFSHALMVDEGHFEYATHVQHGVLTAMLVQQRAAVLFGDLLIEREQLPAVPLRFGNEQKLSRSWLGVPFLNGDEVVGVISVQSYTPYLYSNDDRDLLLHIANVVAVALANVRLVRQQAELSEALSAQVAARTRELAGLSAIAGELALRLPLPRLLNQALSLGMELLGFDAGNVRLLDEQRNVLVLLAHRGFPDSYAQATAVSNLATSPIRSVVFENRPLLITRQMHTLPGRALLPHFEAVASVPLRIGDRVLGTLSLFNRTAREFSEQEISLAQAIADQIAMAVEHARLLEERERQIAELRTLGNVSLAAAQALDLPTLLRRVYAALAEFLRLDAFSMLVYDAEHELIIDGLSIDEGQEYSHWARQPLPAGSLSARIINSRQPLLFKNLPEEMADHPELVSHLIGSGRPAISWLGVPIFQRDDQPIGLIAVQSYEENVFSERDLVLLTNVARQVALHIQNVRLLTQRAHQILDLDAIGRAGRLVAASYDLEEMLDGVYRILTETVRAGVFYLLICEPGSRQITNAIFIEEGVKATAYLPGSRPQAGSLTEWILTQRRPLLIDDMDSAREQLARQGAAPVPFSGDYKIRSWVGVPLLAQGSEPIGVISLQDNQAHLYDADTVELLRQVASHVSLGVQKIRLLEAEQEARRTADTLREVARVLSSSFDPAEVLQLILQELHKVIAYDTASIMLLDGQQLRIAASRGWPAREDPRGAVFAVQQSAAGRVLQEQRPILTQNTQDNPDWLTQPPGERIHSWIGVPLIARGQSLGVLNIDAYQRDYFSARDMSVAETFARHAAVALENARLYQESVTRVEQEMAIARQIQSNLFPSALPQIAGLQMAARCLPARETGGDFFDVVCLPGNRVGILVGDVSGKSLPAAMLMAVARSVTRSEALHHQEPSAVMRSTNHWIALDVPPSTFVALNYALLDLRRAGLALSSAGQLAPLRRQADGQLEYLEVPPPALPLGLIDNLDYAAERYPLQVGDTIVFYTDGIVEARDAERRLFGFERLEALIRRHGDLPPAQLIDHILSAVGTFVDGAPQQDDMTLLVVRRTT